VVLHYTDTGSGPAIVFVPGGNSDYRMWNAQIATFAAHHRVITYSRRYNFPNSNKPIDGYSARVDATDLANLIGALKLVDASIVGHSYGALTTLFLLVDHPELVDTAVLAEPPAISLLSSYPPSPLLGHEMQLDLQYKLTAPMTAAFRAGDRVGGVRAFFDYVAGPGFYQNLPEAFRKQSLANAAEWEVMLTRGTFFPEIDAGSVRQIRTPVLLLAGSETNPFLMMVHETLKALLPNAEEAIISGSSHPMFVTHKAQSEKAVLDFLARREPVANH
jgi:pimeloyl-ACP methyl ester carboxylesterase